MPAFRKAGLPVAGLYDPDFAKADALAAKWGVKAFRSVEEAVAVKDAVFDLATPPGRHAEVLRALPDGAAVVIQKPMGGDLAEATEILRITRAKKKITQARIPYRVPPAQELPERVDAVLTVVHLLLTTGHSAPGGEELVRVDLVARALDLARMLRQLLPTDPEVAGLLALVLYTDARRATRRGPNGRLLLLSEQDRSRKAFCRVLSVLVTECAEAKGPK